MTRSGGLWQIALLLAFLVGCSQPPPQPPTVSTTRLDAPQVTLIEQRRQAVLNTPDSADAWGGLAMVLDAVEYDPEAALCYEQAAKLDPASPKWPHLLSLIQLQEQPEAAIANLRRAADLTRGNPDISRLKLAQVLVEHGDYDQAVTELNLLLARQPLHAAARLEMARVHLLRDALNEAAAALVPCLTNGFTSRPALLLMAQVLQRQGLTKEAAARAQQARNMPRQFDWPDPFLREVLRMRADRGKLQDRINSLLMAGRVQEGETALGHLLTAYPQDTEGLLLLGRLRFQQQRCPEAETALRAHLNASPGSLNGLIQLALAVLCQERWTDGSLILRQALAIKPDFAQAHYNLGYALSRSGDPNGAITAFTEALRCSPGDIQTLVSLADELFRANRPEEGETYLKTALELNPNHPNALRLRERHRGQ